MGATRGASLAVLAVLAACKNDSGFSNRTGFDEWAQAPNNEVDILFVVDNSGSMSEEQEALKNGFEAFVSEMENTQTEFHIGLISTSFDYNDPNRGTLIGNPPYLTNADDYVRGFKDRVAVGIGGSDKEKGLAAMEYALSQPLQAGANAGFIRPEAQLLVVIISDEEDCSDDFALEGQPPDACYTQPEALVPVEQYVETLQNMKTNPDFVQFASIVGLDNSCPDAFPASRYMQVSAYTGGVVGHICSTDWSGIMAGVGLNATSVKTTFFLTYAANLETLEVTVDLDGTLLEPSDEESDDVPVNQDSVNGYTYDPSGPSITFHGDSVPPRGAVVFAEYEIDPAGPADATSTTAP